MTKFHVYTLHWATLEKTGEMYLKPAEVRSGEHICTFSTFTSDADNQQTRPLSLTICTSFFDFLMAAQENGVS